MGQEAKEGGQGREEEINGRKGRKYAKTDLRREKEEKCKAGRMEGIKAGKRGRK